MPPLSVILLPLTKWTPCGEVRRQDGCWTADIKVTLIFGPSCQGIEKRSSSGSTSSTRKPSMEKKHTSPSEFPDTVRSLRWSLTRLAEPRLSWSVNPWPDWSKEQRCSPALSQSPSSGLYDAVPENGGCLGCVENSLSSQFPCQQCFPKQFPTAQETVLGHCDMWTINYWRQHIWWVSHRFNPSG